MAAEVFDTIIVGARCAGASLATHLARAGQRVLLLDAAKLPSDQPISTHVISPRGAPQKAMRRGPRGRRRSSVIARSGGR
jgi:flavin-dependent dehydrogenase